MDDRARRLRRLLGALRAARQDLRGRRHSYCASCRSYVLVDAEFLARHGRTESDECEGSGSRATEATFWRRGLDQV